jgi:preprotein translocase subunit SecE
VKTETLETVKPPARRDGGDGGDEGGRGGLTAGPFGWWGRGREFVHEVRQEMKRVTWPSRKEVYATTFVVILTSLFFGLYLFGVDLMLNAVVSRLFQRFGAA